MPCPTLTRVALPGLALTVALSASACAPLQSPDGRFEYRVAPPASNPHDVSRPVIKVPRRPVAG